MVGHGQGELLFAPEKHGQGRERSSNVLERTKRGLALALGGLALGNEGGDIPGSIADAPKADL